MYAWHWYSKNHFSLSKIYINPNLTQTLMLQTLRQPIEFVRNGSNFVTLLEKKK